MGCVPGKHFCPEWIRVKLRPMPSEPAGSLPGIMTRDQLRHWRKERGLTQVNLASLLGLSRSAYLYLENGDRRRPNASPTLPRTVELALRGLDSEIKAAFQSTEPDGLRHAYAKAIDFIAEEQRATALAVASEVAIGLPALARRAPRHIR